MGSLLPLVIFFGIVYVFFIMPEQKKSKKMKQMMNDLKKGDVVFTRGGIHGTIVGINESVVTIATGPDKVKIDVMKGGIGSVDVSASAAASTSVEEEKSLEAGEAKSPISLDKKNEESAE